MAVCAECGTEIDFGYYFGKEGYLFCSTCTANKDIHELVKELQK